MRKPTFWIFMFSVLFFSPFFVTYAEENTDNAQTLYESTLKVSEAENYTQSAQLFRQAAELGHAEAQRELGVAYIEGFGMEKK